MGRKVALISLYDEFCIGLRHIAGHLTANGHTTTIVNFKRYTQQAREEVPKDIDNGYLTGILPRGEVYLDYSSPISQQEEDYLFDILSKEDYALVGFSVPSYHAHIAADFTRRVQERFGIPVIWGGVHATIATQDCLDRGAADFVCVGEGEELILDLMKELEKGTPHHEIEISGLCVRQPDGTFRKPPERMPPAELDDLALPQYDPTLEYLIEDDKVYHNEPLTFSQIHWTYKMNTGRGCPYFCSFCVWSTIKRDMPKTKKLRRRSPQSVINEILGVLKKNPQVRMIEFEDDIFTVQKKWLDEFAPLYKEQIGLPFWCYTYPNYVSDDNLETLKDMGIAYITMGVQSGSDRINYEVFDRRTERDRVIAAMDTIAKHDILANYDIITNNPYEKDEDRMETLTLLARIPGRYNLHMGKLAWFPGTTLTQRAEKEGMLNAVDEKLYRFWNALYQMAHLKLATEEQLVALTKDEFLMENSQILWAILKQYDELSMMPHQVEVLRGQKANLERENQKLRQELDSLKGRRVVQYGTRLADRLKGVSKENPKGSTVPA
ncbi:B12-binding domain-containing radical SAM protein [bacterium]|nr:B12-binding domain-containing radical SAM protein [bacterium]